MCVYSECMVQGALTCDVIHPNKYAAHDLLTLPYRTLVL